MQQYQKSFPTVKRHEVASVSRCGIELSKIVIFMMTTISMIDILFVAS